MGDFNFEKRYCILHTDREEAVVMANLRKRVAACDLERRRPLSGDSLPSEPNLDELDNRPLLTKVCVWSKIWGQRIGKRIFFCRIPHFFVYKKLRDTSVKMHDP